MQRPEFSPKPSHIEPDMVNQIVFLSQWEPGSVRNPVSNNKMESDGRKEETLTSGLYTCMGKHINTCSHTLKGMGIEVSNDTKCNVWKCHIFSTHSTIDGHLISPSDLILHERNSNVIKISVPIILNRSNLNCHQWSNTFCVACLQYHSVTLV